MAKSIMKSRQNGIPIVEMMKTLDKLQANSKTKETGASYKLAKALVLDAYKTPKYSTEEIKTSIITEFANKTYTVCYSARHK